MVHARGLIRKTLFITMVIFTLTLSPAVQTAGGIPSMDYEVTIYDIAMPESTQRDIGKLCEENRLSYELVLAIYHTEGSHETEIDSIKAEIEQLVYIRDYWTAQGFPDEVVFDLMLLSRQRGIEGCRIFMQNNASYHLDSYVQKVTEYKYFIEQSLNNHHSPDPGSVSDRSQPVAQEDYRPPIRLKHF